MSFDRIRRRVNSSRFLSILSKAGTAGSRMALNVFSVSQKPSVQLGPCRESAAELRGTAAAGQFLLKSGVQAGSTGLSDGGQWARTVRVPAESNLIRDSSLSTASFSSV